MGSVLVMRVFDVTLIFFFFFFFRCLIYDGVFEVNTEGSSKLGLHDIER